MTSRYGGAYRKEEGVLKLKQRGNARLTSEDGAEVVLELDFGEKARISANHGPNKDIKMGY